MDPQHLDPQFVEKIVQEIKSQGIFDEFRKDSIADVDTKPAYQNLRQRVENSVKEFLSKQVWTPDMNKNQLRERLRRHITESNFLDVGVERIVDQVVNPKIATEFRPKIEGIAYQCMGISPPEVKNDSTPLIHALPPLPLNGTPLRVQTADLLPTDLEQISPDSDKIAEKSNGYDDMDIEEEKIDEDEESPPFEPLVKYPSVDKLDEEEAHDADLSTGDSNIKNVSNDDVYTQQLCVDTQESTASGNTPEQDSGNFRKAVSRSLDVTASQGSHLSQISSNSRISPDYIESNVPTEQSSLNDPAAVNISEEAQMPKFNENSSEGANSQNNSQLHFDIKKDEIKFEGTERKGSLLPAMDNENVTGERTESGESMKNDTTDGKTNMGAPSSPFQFANINVKTHRPPVPQENSSISSLEDTNSNNLFIAEKTSERSKTPEPTTTAPVHVSKPSTPPPPMPQREKKEERVSASSHSRRYSKEKRRFHEKDNRGSKHSERSRDKDSRSKYSSSSSKYSSSTKNMSHRSDDAEKKSTKRSYYASSCSSSRSGHESKRDKRKREDSSRSASRNKDEHRRKSSAPNDDHNESRKKLRKWRKSTDSNDEDKSHDRGPGGVLSKSAHKASSSASKNSSSQTKVKSKTSDDSKSHAKNDATEQTEDNDKHRSKVVILNDILVHPATNFIELETASHAKRVQVVTSVTPCALASSNAVVSDTNELLCFDEKVNPFYERIVLLNNIIDSLRRDSNDNVPELHDGKKVNATSVECEYKERRSSETTIDDGGVGRFGIERGAPKFSPTSSDTSVNSKENKIYDKNLVDSKQDNAIDGQSNHVMTKLSQQQRYTSEDLYKPRPLLSQRSKRRHMD